MAVHELTWEEIDSKVKTIEEKYNELREIILKIRQKTNDPEYDELKQRISLLNGLQENHDKLSEIIQSYANDNII